MGGNTPGTLPQLADVEIVAIPVCHDAADPCGFLIRTAEGSVTVLTDLGCPSSAATEAIAESRLVVLEANHDEAMLRRGPYPQRLQRRILSTRAISRTPGVPTCWHGYPGIDSAAYGLVGPSL